MQDAFKDILYGYAFFMPRDLEIHQNLYLYFVKMTSQNIQTYFAQLFFFASSIRKNKKVVVIVVFEIDVILGQYGHCP